MAERYIQVDNFVMKCRAYPTKEQAEKIDKIFHGLRVAYNATAYEITNQNEFVTNLGKDGETRWPNFSNCQKKEWLDKLRNEHEAVRAVPAAALSSSAYGVFKDMQKSWETFHPEMIGVQKTDKNGNPRFKKNGDPVWKRTEKPIKLPCGKWEPSYYSNKNPRNSFTVQTQVSGFVFPENSKTVFVNVSTVGKIKCRGWRHDLHFGDTPSQTFSEFYKNDKKKRFGVTVSKDNCGDYFIVAKLQTVWKLCKESSPKTNIGVDVGITDLAITSDGVKYPNKRFKLMEKKRYRRLSRKISRRMGWANEEFREAHKKDKELAPSKGYSRAVLERSRLDRKISRRRANHNNNVTADIVSKASFIGIEDLLVTGMMKNRHLAYSASDAAMSDVLEKLKYKAEWQKVPIKAIGRFEPSSQLCHICGYRNKKVKNTNIREWTCPECGTHHDRDINAAKNILNMALEKASE